MGKIASGLAGCGRVGRNQTSTPARCSAVRQTVEFAQEPAPALRPPPGDRRRCWKALLAAVCGLNPKLAGRTMSTARALCGSWPDDERGRHAEHYIRAAALQCPLTDFASFIKVRRLDPLQIPKDGPPANQCISLRGLNWGSLAGFNCQIIAGTRARTRRGRRARRRTHPPPDTAARHLSVHLRYLAGGCQAPRRHALCAAAQPPAGRPRQIEPRAIPQHSLQSGRRHLARRDNCRFASSCCGPATTCRPWSRSPPSKTAWRRM